MLTRYVPLFQYKEKINSFDGEYAFLSPDYPVEFTYKNKTYHSVREAFEDNTSNPSDLYTMGNVLLRRFGVGQEDREKLFALEFAYITWKNNDHKNYWGSCSCPDCWELNQNNYGKLLMEVRNYLLCQKRNLERVSRQQQIKKYKVSFYNV